MQILLLIGSLIIIGQGSEPHINASMQSHMVQHNHVSKLSMINGVNADYENDNPDSKRHVQEIVALLSKCPVIAETEQQIEEIISTFQAIKGYNMSEIFVAMLKFLSADYSRYRRFKLYLMNEYLFLGCARCHGLVIPNEFIFLREESLSSHTFDPFWIDAHGKLVFPPFTWYVIGHSRYEPIEHFILLRRACGLDQL
jgi:hypothetical protein